MVGEVDNTAPFYFYKIILKNETKKRIPPAFLEHISRDFSDTATLRVVSGGSWTVKVSIRGNDVFMEDGWQEFVRDNSLGNHEYLVFKYDGNMCFSVTIFNPSGVERIGTSDIRMHQEPAGFPVEKRPRGRPKRNRFDTLNSHCPPFNSNEQGSAGDGLACHKSKKLKQERKRKNVNDKSRSLKQQEKERM